MVVHFASNIKFLRKRKGRSQDEMAFTLGIPRSTLSGYENEVAEPGFEMLVKISEYFGISTDVLLKGDISEVQESKLSEMERSSDPSGKDLRVLAITVDEEEKENIELVPEKAKAGYTTGYSDPQFVGLLSKFQLPFLGKTGTFRTFQISGDSMPPLKDGYWVTGKYVENWTHIRDGIPHVILTKDDGIVFKLIYNRIDESGQLLLVSTNPIYEPYLVHVDQILEIWEFEHSINSDFEVS